MHWKHVLTIGLCTSFLQQVLNMLVWCKVIWSHRKENHLQVSKDFPRSWDDSLLQNSSKYNLFLQHILSTFKLCKVVKMTSCPSIHLWWLLVHEHKVHHLKVINYLFNHALGTCKHAYTKCVCVHSIYYPDMCKLAWVVESVQQDDAEMTHAVTN